MGAGGQGTCFGVRQQTKAARGLVGGFQDGGGKVSGVFKRPHVLGDNKEASGDMRFDSVAQCLSLGCAECKSSTRSANFELQLEH